MAHTRATADGLSRIIDISPQPGAICRRKSVGTMKMACATATLALPNALNYHRRRSPAKESSRRPIG
jgi:hypothetical protein